MIDWSKPIRFIPDKSRPARVICTNRKGLSMHLPVMVLLDFGTHEATLYCQLNGYAPAFGWFENVPEGENQ